MPRGRGFSTGKAISILFRLLADGRQARAETKETVAQASKEIRSFETLGQRVLTILSRPVRGRLGLFGALGISTLRDQLRELADKEIKKVHEGFEAVAPVVERAAARSTRAFTATGAVLRNTKNLADAHSASVKNIAKDYADTTAAIRIFQKVVERTPGSVQKGTFGSQVAQGPELRAILRSLQVSSSRGLAPGGSFKAIDAEKGLQEFAVGFAKIENAGQRAALATRVFGADVGRVLPVLEAHRLKLLAASVATGNLRGMSELFAGKTIPGVAAAMAKQGNATAAVTAQAQGLTSAFNGMNTANQAATAASLAAVPATLSMGAAFGIVAAAVAAAVIGVTLYLGVLFLIAKASASTDAVIGRLADSLGVTAEFLSALDTAAKKADQGGIKDIQQRLGSFERILGQVKTGKLPEVSSLLLRLGVDAKSGSVGVEEAAKTVINAFNRTNDPTTRALILQKLFADRTGNLGKTFRAVGPDFDKWVQSLKESGRLLDDQGAKKAKEFEEQVKLLSSQWAAFGQRVGRQVVPEVTKALKILSIEWKGVGSIANIVGRGMVSTLRLAIEDIILLGAVAKTTKESLDIGTFASFGTRLEENRKQLRAFLESTKDTIEENLDEANEESIRALKRASDARIDALEAGGQEAERIEKNLTAMYRRQFQLRVIGQADAVQKEIDAKRTQAEAELTIARAKTREEEIRKLDPKKEETEDNRAANLAKLREKEKEISDRFDREEKDAKAQLAADLRDQADKQHEDAITATREEAATTIGILRRQMDDDINLRLENTLKINAIERGLTGLMRDELQRRLLNVGKNAQLEAEIIAQTRAFNAKADDEENQRKQAVLDARLAQQQEFIAREAAGLQLRLLQNQFFQSKFEDQAKRGVISQEQAVRQSVHLDEVALSDRITLLKQQIAALEQFGKDATRLKEQLAELQQEKVNLVADSERKIRDAMEEQLDRRRDVFQEAVDLEFDTAERLLGIRQEDLQNFRAYLAEHGRSELKALDDQIAIAAEYERLLHEQNINNLEARIQRIVDDGRFNDEDLALLRALNAAIEAENERHRVAVKNQRTQAAEDRRKLTKEESGLNTGLETGQLAQLKQGVQEFADVAKVSFSAVGAVVNGLAQGVGQLVQNWVLLGTTGPNAFRKLVASVLAGVSAQAAVLAIMELAYGFAALTPWGAAIYGPAPFHFKAAALFGAVALITGLAGRKIAGNAFQQNASTAGASSASTAAALQTIVTARNAQQKTVYVVLRPDGTRFGQAVKAEIHEDYSNGGVVYDVVHNGGQRS